MIKPLYILISLFLFTQISTAINRCESILINDRSHELFVTPEVKEIARDKGKNGGQVIYLKRQSYVETHLLHRTQLIDHKWYNYDLSPDKPGDWRWAFEHLPASIQNFFGLKVLTSELIEIKSPKDNLAQILIIPSADEIVHGHEKLNLIIKKNHTHFHLFRYYKSDSIIDGKDYIRLIGDHGALPIGTNNYLLQHDWNYHVLSGLVIPEPVMNALQTRAKLLVKFYEHCQVFCKHVKNGEYLLSKIQESYFHYASRTFDLTGNIFHETISKPRLYPDRTNEILDTMEIVFLKKTKPIDYLNQFLQNIKVDFVARKTNGFEQLNDFYLQFIQSLRREYHQTDLDSSFFSDSRVMISLSHQKLKQLDLIIQNENKKLQQSLRNE